MMRSLLLPLTLRDRYVFLFAFAYILCVGAIAQLWLIPHYFADPSARIGLLPNTDASLYHHAAMDLFDALETLGWRAWKLYPEGHSLSGIAAAMYYLFVPLPLVMLPFSALAHGCVALGLISMGHSLGFSRQAMRVGALVYILLPSSLLWLVQLNKDIYFILGLVLVMRSWMWLVPPASKQQPLGQRAELCATYMLGLLLIWLTRPYAVGITQIALVAAFVFFLGLRLCFIGKHGLLYSASVGLAAIVAISVLTQALTYLPERLKGERAVMLTSWNAIAERHEVPAKAVHDDANIVTESKVTQRKVTVSKVTESKVTESKVTEGEVTKGKIVRYLELLVAQRLSYVTNDGKAASRIDVDAIHTIEDIPLYAPRAMIVGYTFPTFWQFLDVKSGASKAAMFIAGLEMLLVNIGLVALLLRQRYLPLPNRLALAMLVACSVLLVVVNVYAIPNLGTLYRVRYGALMLLAVLGWAAIVEMRQARKEAVNQATQAASLSL